MIWFCHIRQFVAAVLFKTSPNVDLCPCQFHRYSRNLDAMRADWEREQEAAPSLDNCHYDEVYR